jgi:ABC-2 type transport system ATP-binding protein
MTGSVVRAAALTKSYADARGIDGVSFEVEEGEVFGFLGPNGAGKTTTIRTLLDFLRADSGTASVLGLDSRRDSAAIRARTGNLPGDFGYDPRWTGRGLLQLLAAIRGMDGLGRAAELAERFDADLSRPLGDLSRGNRQKIGLVQALFHNPELAFLDEPTGGLDPLMQEQFLALLVEERANGRTVFLSSHDLAEVERVCDRVAIIREGRIAAIERVSALTEKGFRHVQIEFREPVSPAEFEALPGVGEVTVEASTLKFRTTGDLDAVVKAAARHTVVDLQIAHPTLEEAFITYYGDGGAS